MLLISASSRLAREKDWGIGLFIGAGHNGSVV